MRGELDVEDALLSHAADSDADFMVMGGYGHLKSIGQYGCVQHLMTSKNPTAPQLGSQLA
jgi:hypothetical protein